MFNKIKGQLKGFFDARIHHEILEEFSLFEQKYLDEKRSLFPKVNDNLVIIDLMLKSSDVISLVSCQP